jgi:hypothetical protein
LLVPWTTLQPSSRARRWRRVGLAIALTSCGALLAAAFASEPFSPILVLVAGVGGLGAWVATLGRSNRRFEVGVSSLGEVMLRQRDGAGLAAPDSGSARTIQVAFASPWLISLRRGTMLVAIWPDSLPQSTYRRLWVHLRWGRAMPSDDDRGAAPTNRANSLDR